MVHRSLLEYQDRKAGFRRRNAGMRTAQQVLSPRLITRCVMGEERRKAVRIKETLFVQYCFDGSSGNKIWDITTVKDFSETGVSMKTIKAFEIGSPIFFRFKIPSRPLENIEVTGKVVGCSKTGQGTICLTRIEFDYLNKDTKTIFHEYISWVIKNRNIK